MRRIKLSKDEVICPRCAGDENAILDTDGCTMCNGTGKVKKSDLRSELFKDVK
jgi:DnaJ-class molecular chaperone